MNKDSNSLTPAGIAMFGQAVFRRDWDGHYTLVGGTDLEQAAARRWITRFFPGIALHVAAAGSDNCLASKPG